MIYFFIGHRGSGKSHLARRLPAYFRAAGQEITIADLDETIEKFEKCSISEIFEKKGEQIFRELEQKYLLKLCQELDSENRCVVIVLGAGFPGPLPPPDIQNSICLWVRRPTDALGRVFLDRPRLNPNQSPIDEFLSRYQQRQPRYSSWAHEEIMISEGFDASNAEEKGFFLNTLNLHGGILTLHPPILPTGSRFIQDWQWKRFIERRLQWGLRLEVRDDLFTPDQIEEILKIIPHSQLLFSLRTSPEKPAFLSQLKEGALWDWPAEWPLQEGINSPVLSLHRREAHESVLDTGRNLEKAAQGLSSHLKLAVEVRTFEELWQGHQWAAEDPTRRTFLPRSSGSHEGRWNWYRLFMKNRAKINFVREGEGSAPDQPYLLDWVRAPECPKTFAAVLGHPVHHSRTPAEHFEFFSKRKMPVVAISITEEEWESALKILFQLGLRAAAVTAPLKIKASQLAKIKTADAARLNSVNTLLWSDKDQQWMGENTDLRGLISLFANLDSSQSIAVWGGGGTLPLLQEALPRAAFYSVRTGTPRTPRTPCTPGSPGFSPEVVIWGVGRSRYSEKSHEEGEAQWPDPNWKPKQVIDLNYSEDSPGREYALRTQAQYISGIEMFRSQAAGQREFWQVFAQDRQS